MEQIDARRALELLTDIVDQYGEDTVYEKVPLLGDQGTGCRYEYEGQPSCMVGIALHRAGASLAFLNGLDKIGAPADRLKPEKGVEIQAARVFQAAQECQDTGKTWGQALHEARTRYESIMNEQAQ